MTLKYVMFITTLIVSITKCLIVIGSLYAYLICNWRVITWVSIELQLSNMNFFNWIAVIGQLCCVQLGALKWVLFIAVSPLLAKLIIKSASPKGTINWSLDFVSFNSGVIMLVITNPPCATRSADLKLLARLLPELYSTQSNYHY